MTNSNTLLNTISEENWALIPSDPAIFDDMIQQYGVQDTKVQEVLTLDFEDLTKDGPVYGLIFISRYIEEPLPVGFENKDPDAENIIFTAQVVTNVCGTLALLAVLFNAEINHKGEILDNFLEFTKDFSPVNRGVCLGNSAEIRRIHDAYATAHHKAENALNDTLSDNEGEDGVEYIDNDDYHYITYIYKNGFLWELDGLKYQPVKICQCDPENWLEATKPLLEKRMNSSIGSNENEITFSLMAVTHDSFSKLSKQNDTLKANIKKFEKALNTHLPLKENTIRKSKAQFLKETDINIPHYSNMQKIWTDIQNGNFEAAKLDVEIVHEYYTELDKKVKMYMENKEIARNDVIRQKFDYFPFINTLASKAFKRKLIEEEPIKTTTKNKKSAASKSSTAPSSPKKRRQSSATKK